MSKVVAIHGTDGFAGRWKDAARAQGCQVREVNGYDSDIMDQLRDCTAFLWHLNQDESADLQFARHVLRACEVKGMRVFPTVATCTHCDDTIAQKYLLEAIDAPLAQTWAFYSERQAAQFLECADYPLVFKLKRGAGSINVQLVRNRGEGMALARRMFGAGISPFPAGERIRRAMTRARKRKQTSDPLLTRAARVMGRFLRQTLRAERERGYVLFQRFIAGNDCDTRVTVIGNRAFAFHRGVRPNDFRASGSGLISHLDLASLPRAAINVAFEISRKLGFQSMAYDFVHDPVTRQPMLLEMSFVFMAQAIHDCSGYLDAGGTWHAESIWPQDVILEDLLS